MLIATYVAVESSNEELLRRILNGIATVSEVRMTVKSTDSEGAEDEEIGFIVRQSSHDGFDYHLFVGFMFKDLKQYVVNVSIPMGSGDATVKIAPYQEVEI